MGPMAPRPPPEHVRSRGKRWERAGKCTGLGVVIATTSAPFERFQRGRAGPWSEGSPDALSPVRTSVPYDGAFARLMPHLGYACIESYVLYLVVAPNGAPTQGSAGLIQSDSRMTGHHILVENRGYYSRCGMGTHVGWRHEKVHRASETQ